MYLDTNFVSMRKNDIKFMEMTEDEFKDKLNTAFRELMAVMAQRVSAEDLRRMEDAFDLACEAHSKQRRKSGEPYIIHPMEVARIVAEELQLGANPVIAAFLHDVVEDTDVTIEEIGRRFGEDVAFLVSVVTKPKKEHYEMSKQLDNYKQMLDSVHYDIRAILIKLADRLHNMRTLDSMRQDKQMKIAGETDYFYAPLANRLGLYDIKTELENLSLRYRCPQEYAQLEQELKRDEEENRSSVDNFVSVISDLLQENGIRAKLEVRYRTPYSIWRKMQARECDFKHLDYRHVIRIIFPDDPFVSDKNKCLQIYSLLTDVFKEKPGGIANYVDSPKENGYQSFHVRLLNGQGGWEEIHITSERMVRNSRLGCIALRTESNVGNWIEKFKGVLQDIAFHSQDYGFLEGVVSSFYSDDILVFTPKGRGVILPMHATALDFAYEIHSGIGEHAQYARINGKLCSVKTELRRGDCVEIGTNERVGPKPDWLNHVLTYKAKQNLLAYFRKQPQAPYVRCTECNPLPGDEVIGFKDEKCGQIVVHKRDCTVAVRQASEQGDSIVAVAFEAYPQVLYPVRISVKAVDRFHLLRDLIDCITARWNLSIVNLNTKTVDEIVDCVIDFSVHSARELQDVLVNIDAIDGVDEVRRVEWKM